jgi:serine/threonine protein kinase
MPGTAVPSTPIGDYQPISVLGTGTYAVVYRARHLSTESEVAMKSVVLDPGSNVCLTEREVEVMKTLDHPFIVCLFDIVRDESRIYLVTELVEQGTLLERISKGRPGLDEAPARRIFHELILALQYLHNERHVCHRDVKAENVLLDRNGHIRLSDFGFARTYENEATLMRTSCGSPAYASPDVIQGTGYTASADIWSAGILLYYMVTGKLPFVGSSTGQLFVAILMWEPEYPTSLSSALRDLLKGLLKKNWTERLTIREILKHPWVSSEVSTCDAMLAEMRVAGVEKLDSVIVEQMRALNLVSPDLLENLNRNVCHRTTAVYKMLRREKQSEELKEWQAKRTGKAQASRVALSEFHPLAQSGGNRPRQKHPAVKMIPRRPGEVAARQPPAVFVPRVRKLGSECARK